MDYYRDRTNLKIKVASGLLTYSGHLGDELQFFLKIMNVRRRPVTLSGAGFDFKNGHHLVIIKPETFNFPHELKEGQSVQVWVKKDDLLETEEKENSKITHAWYSTCDDFCKTKYFLKK